jgi:hypothetical protein
VTFFVKPLGCNPFLMSTIKRAGKPVRFDIERREPRCRICRHESGRIQVNKLLDWHGVPVFLEGGKTHWTTYADILRVLEPLNQGRDTRDRITYDSLWIHAKRHYEIAGIAAYWSVRINKELRYAYGKSRVSEPIEQLQRTAIKYEEKLIPGLLD